VVVVVEEYLRQLAVTKQLKQTENYCWQQICSEADYLVPKWKSQTLLRCNQDCASPNIDAIHYESETFFPPD
jgi:hypothetical protein